MNQILVENLVKEIKKTISDEINILSYLRGLLSLGNEAIYRRLRGDVPFNMNELFLICKDLNISLDAIMGMQINEKVIFDVVLISQQEKYDLLSRLSDHFENYVSSLQRIKIKTELNFQIATNQLPFAFYFYHQMLPKFALYKWLYPLNIYNENIPFSEFKVPSKISDLFLKLMKENRNLPLNLIITRNIFMSVAKDILFFSKLNLISDQERKVLKEELMETISDMEKVAVLGTWEGGIKVNIYLSNIDLETIYVYCGGKDFETAYIGIYSIGAIKTQDKQFCSTHNEWINSLKRYSILITQSADIERIEFFKSQRELVDSYI